MKEKVNHELTLTDGEQTDYIQIQKEENVPNENERTTLEIANQCYLLRCWNVYPRSIVLPV